MNFVFGVGLNMAPSDMALRVGTQISYNNKIIIATEDQNIGVNDGLNERIITPFANTTPLPTPVKNPDTATPSKETSYYLVAPSGKALQWSKGYWTIVLLSDADKASLDGQKIVIDYKSGKPLTTPTSTGAGETRVSIGIPGQSWSTLTYKDEKLIQTSRPRFALAGNTRAKQFMYGVSSSDNKFKLKSAPSDIQSQPTTHEDYKSALILGSAAAGLLFIWLTT